MQKIDIKLVLIFILIALNTLHLLSMNKPDPDIDVSNVFLKDKIESLNRDINMINLKLRMLENIQVKLDNIKHDIEDLDSNIINKSQ